MAIEKIKIGTPLQQPALYLLPPSQKLQLSLLRLLLHLPKDGLSDVSGLPDPPDPEAVRRYLFDAERFFAGGQQETYFLEDRGELIGSIALYHTDPANRTGEIGFWLIPSARGQGKMQAAADWLITRAFRQRHLHRLVLKTAPGNQGSRRLALRLGFQHEGRLRKAKWKEGQATDLDLYSLLAPEWT